MSGRHKHNTVTLRVPLVVKQGIEKMSRDQEKTQQCVLEDLLVRAFDTAANYEAVIAKQAAQIADLLKQVAALQEHTRGGVFLMPHNR